MGEIRGRVASDVALFGLVAPSAVLSEPIVGVAQVENATAVRLDVLTAVVRPDGAGLDGVRRRA